MKTSSKHFLAAAALAGLVTGCATKPAAKTCAGQPASTCCAVKKSACSAKSGCGGSTTKKSGN